ncbi:MAG: CBS domain-containing protein [Deltaproteobacteria bacterium]|nr:CBS domain-containing protein [Deltaproteobacteria bacterium]
MAAKSPEGKSNIFSSPATVMRSNTSVIDCIRQMKKRLVGSILIVSDDATEKLEGIFTERDILMKFEHLAKGDALERPISAIMTKPVRVIQSEEFEKSAEIMIKYGFRHLPVVANDKYGGMRILGVVSMRDLMKIAIAGTAALPISDTAIGATIGVVSADPYFAAFIETGLPENLKITVRNIILNVLVEEARGLRAVVLDIDGLDSDHWVQALKSFNKNSAAPYTVIVYSPFLHRNSTVQILEKLGASKKISVFAKPVLITELFSKLRSAL